MNISYDYFNKDLWLFQSQENSRHFGEKYRDSIHLSGCPPDQKKRDKENEEYGRRLSCTLKHLFEENRSFQNVNQNDRTRALSPARALIVVVEGMSCNASLTRRSYLLVLFIVQGHSLSSAGSSDSMVGILSQLLCSQRNVILISTDKSALKTKLRGGRLEECFRGVQEEQNEQDLHSNCTQKLKLVTAIQTLDGKDGLFLSILG